MTQLQRASIHWQTDTQGHTIPVSEAFDDVYFSRAGGLTETHYVFLQGNQLPTRFANLQAHQSFVIAETGFGTGLNFLATCLLWSQNAPKNARLHFISTEKFPLSLDDLQLALTAWRDEHTTPWIDALLSQYPLLMAGCHRLHISDQITLDLWFGDALESFESILHTSSARRTASDTAIKGVDAWFLDGFAPSKNSDLWSDELFALMAQLSDTHATVATFTAAGFVRRGLMAAGFEVQKIKGFGHKREMLTAQIHNQATNTIAPPKSIAIIGAGISGVMSAIALSRRGHRVTLIDKNLPMSGASGNPRALLAPKLTLLGQAMHHLPTVSFLYAQRIYKNLSKSLQESDTHSAPIFEPTGAVDFLLPSQKSAEKRSAQIAPYPDALIYQMDDSGYQTADIATFVPLAGLINTQSIAKLIAHLPNITVIQDTVDKLEKSDNSINLYLSNGGVQCYDSVVICAGFESELLDDTLFKCRKIRGQLSWVTFPQLLAQKGLPKTPIKYDGYCAAFDDDGEHKFLFGASFVRNSTDTTISLDEHRFNLSKLTAALPDIAAILPDVNEFHGKVGIRAQTPDYHPLVGQIDTQLFTLYGMGSKGFSFAPLCAEILADLMDGTILPIDQVLLDKLNPKRERLQTPLTDLA
ncbi:tRNA (5-methylaminomethyl-2-thiouridine)(34)-methyltransferase MnmD [Moraxella sp. FZLJ2107]|uniref:tRNA (5-methylaminomethyl-2-thiouridine)(34)-methyltransferase MnmD n=1 Tax=unclassified Moraxella TaxID=2685852 RepID=UPI0020C88DE1|nr:MULTISPECIES: tRNA (5-methylaminomethyl-2-thiouridine)(34)-methyltransferase MnmD [unclassified Moraxella]UTO05322.1 tRNA (5-methylaminomethyl-2-thiouridine)(34)-methyltransferase MnmD [Moraxella sp. FZLJ2107]UTO22057.1 tRNA (5-methylaminomethyl-2-thiouridine)(34)-methyltransferase MnmD [Moraxella sp. FZLJ2109]